MGPDELQQIAIVAHRFYKEGALQTEIAKELGISRFKVARMLEHARENGIVTIQINVPGSVDGELSVALRQKYGLRRAFAVSTPSQDAQSIHSSIGRVGAALLAEMCTEDDVLGVSSGRTLIAMAGHLRGLQRCDVVQLSGLVGAHQENSAEIIRRVSGISRGRAYSIYAPLVVADARTARALRDEPSVRQTFDRFSAVTKAVIAIGSWSPPDSQMFNALDVQTRERLVERGVRAEVCATPLDENGSPVDDVADRALAMHFEQLTRVPEIIAIAGGPKKTEAIRATLKGGFVTTMITDAATARRLTR